MNKENEQALAALILNLDFGEMVSLSRQLGALMVHDSEDEADCWEQRLGGEYVIALGLYSWAEGVIEQSEVTS